MNYDNLPTDDLKEFGIIGADNTFSKKLSNDDIQKFLKGESLVADDGKDRVVFQLKDENTRLEVNVFQRDRAISDILNEAEKGISYSSIEKKNSANDILGTRWDSGCCLTLLPADFRCRYSSVHLFSPPAACPYPQNDLMS